MRAIFSLLVALALLSPCHAQTCNPPSGWLFQDKQATINNAMTFGPQCGQLQDAGSPPSLTNNQCGSASNAVTYSAVCGSFVDAGSPPALTSQFVTGTWTPNPVCGTATFTVASTSTLTINKMTYVDFEVVVATLGTCTTIISINVPKNVAANTLIPALYANANTFALCTATTIGSTTIQCAKSGGAAWIAGDQLFATGWYPNQ